MWTDPLVDNLSSLMFEATRLLLAAVSRNSKRWNFEEKLVVDI
jgi:hypothetical protein